ncbi:MAG: 50S ribosomal protein L4 [Alphaproteobacteria bacterium]|nr:50S ribosomal protein L4 [Alphaproteobacteria bacterium]
MKASVVNLENKKVGEVELADAVFGVEAREDILARMIHWQLAKRRSGTHSTKEIWAVQGTTKKPHSQKGTGSARQGSKRSPQFRGGAVIFGPHPRSHAYNMPKKVRVQALCMALAAKQKEGKLIVLEAAKVDAPKTKQLAQQLTKIGAMNALIVDGANLDLAFARAARNLPFVDVLPEQGVNVYDIVRHDTLVLTKNAVEQLQARLQKAGKPAAKKAA